MEFNKIQEFLELKVEDCIYKIEIDYTEDELKKWDKIVALDYLIEYLDCERSL